MKDNDLHFDRSCHVLYSKPCKKEIRAKIALHYPQAEREAVWEKVQRKYVDFLSDWRTDLGGRQNFHNGAGGTYDCIAIMSYYVVCKAVTSFREIEEIEENLILPSFRKLKFADCNKPFWRKLMYKAFLRAKARLTIKISPSIMNLPPVPQRSLLSATVLRRSCPPCAMWIMHPWSCSTQGWCGQPPARMAVSATTPSAVTGIRT